MHLLFVEKASLNLVELDFLKLAGYLWFYVNSYLFLDSPKEGA
jgi:hypothetical protein